MNNTADLNQVSEAEPVTGSAFLVHLTYNKNQSYFQRIFEATEALRASAETFDRFFRAGAPLNENTDSDGANPRK